MQKNWLLSSTLILLALNCFAQNKNNGTIAFSIGPSFPVGNYSKKDIMNNSAGLAKAGETASISYYGKRKKQFGFTVAMQAQRNPLNTKAFEDGFSQAKFNQFVGAFSGGPIPPPPPPSSYTTYPKWKFDKHAWFTASLLAGCYAEFASHNASLSFIFKGMIGGLYASSPKVKGKSITDTATASYEQTSKSGVGFTYLTSGGVKYQLSKKLSLCGDIEYAGTNDIKFKKIKATLLTTHGSSGSLNYSVAQSTTTTDGRQKITSINFRIGVGLRL